MIDFGLAPDEFRERYSEREPYLRRHALRGAPFAWAELDAALHRVEPTAPALQLWSAGPIAEERYTDVVPRPPHWGGYRVTPETIEFWQGNRSRLHDRLRYTLLDGVWSITRHYP